MKVDTLKEEVEVLVEGSEDSLVEVYADRLCAVTHALALCCSTMQKAGGKYVCVCMYVDPVCHEN